MSSANALSTPAQSRRRFHARRRIEGLIYVDFGPDNGAILIDLGEGGLGFQSVAPVSIDQAVLLKFKVPGETNPVESYAEVAWLNQTGKGGGLRFVELSANARAQIRGFAGEQLPEPGALESEDAAEVHAGPEAATTDRLSAQASQSLGENTQPPSPILESSNAPLNALHSAQLEQHEPEQHEAEQPEAVYNEVPAGPSAGPGTLLTEFLVELASEANAADPLVTFDEEPHETPTAATHVVHSAALESAPPPEEQDAPEEQYPEDVAASEAATIKPLGIPRTPPLAPEIPQRHAAPAAKPLAPRSSDTRNSDARNLPQPPKRQRKPAPSNPEPSAPSKLDSSLPLAHRQDATARGSFARQSAKPAFADTGWDNLDGRQGDVAPQATMASQALKVAIGAVAGACLVLALVFAVPSLRTAVQTTANARSGASTLANAPSFQVEVADLNNRRWILRSGGDAGSPFGDTPSRRDTQPAASNSSRKDSAKSSRSDDSDQPVEVVAAPQAKVAKPADLALSRPLAKPADAPATQLLAPSIFDGITPPIGSLTDRLPTSGPDIPGVVQPASPAVGRQSELQSAVLLQRVAPVYPSGALQARVQGQVSVNATIGKDGIPKDLKLIKGDQRLAEAAFTAIRQWHYRPATLAGIPIETQTVVTVSFELK